MDKASPCSGAAAGRGPLRERHDLVHGHQDGRQGQRHQLDQEQGGGLRCQPLQGQGVQVPQPHGQAGIQQAFPTTRLQKLNKEEDRVGDMRLCSVCEIQCPYKIDCGFICCDRIPLASFLSPCVDKIVIKIIKYLKFSNESFTVDQD
jgi:hypothetical protein